MGKEQKVLFYMKIIVRKLTHNQKIMYLCFVIRNQVVTKTLNNE